MRALLLPTAFVVTGIVGISAQANSPTPLPPAPQSAALAFAPPPDLTMPPADAVKSGSGLISKVVKPGDSAEKPSANDVVTVQYTGWSSDGRMFDSTLARNAPSTFPLSRAMAGWKECVGLMVLHETRRCWVPEALSWKGQAGRPKGTVVFESHLGRQYGDSPRAIHEEAMAPPGAPRGSLRQRAGASPSDADASRVARHRPPTTLVFHPLDAHALPAGAREEVHPDGEAEPQHAEPGQERGDPDHCLHG